ncbi:MAG: tungsten formylmethanofuran dehydrogenase [Nanoarchaeota archaeon]|mgnify:CR=1 FL=1|jgi:2-oxoglutarate ferredoxin oxidoreductase subunit delta|nr:tungsten formylmethanofuran dehydrogenase [Nanoarchaeota archaeon]|tara:strand:- start:1243 stop:1479 length:237 start_codon:yes stop_codon:yes gene_type:complete
MERLPKGFIKVLEEDCKGCGVCMDACLEDTLEISERRNGMGHRYIQQVRLEDCTGCGLCYIQCPSSAIEVYKLVEKEL